MPIVRGSHSFEADFTRIPNTWVRDPRLSLKAKGLLAQLMSHAPGWTVSVKSLASANGCGLDSIRGALDELISAGYLSRSGARERNDSGQLMDYTYTTHDPEAPTSEKPTLEKPTLDNPTPKKTSSKEEQVLRNNVQAELEREFAEFWKLYPRRVGRAAAFRAYAKARVSEPASLIIGGAIQMSEDRNLPETRFIPHPATWLNRAGWLDEPYPPRERSKEELAAIELERIRRRNELEREHSRRVSEEMRQAAEQATEAPRCEHGKNIATCLPCARRLAEHEGY